MQYNDNDNDNSKITISHIITEGDSLSDRGTMDHRRLFGFIPMSVLTGLYKESAKGRFGNGFVWDDDFAGILASQFLIHHYKKRKLTSTQISDDIIIKGEIEQNLQKEYSLDNNMGVNYYDANFVRNYNEGGATSANYKHDNTFNLLEEGARKIVSNLDEKRNLLLEDDKKNNINEDYKKKALIIEWSGANDLITVNRIKGNNKGSSFEDAEKAVEARIKNIEELIKNGYSNFVLFNLPDLSLTPRFQNGKEQDKKEAKFVSDYFNSTLEEKCKELRKKYPTINLDIFDVNKIFTEMHQAIETGETNNPKLKEYVNSFDKDKLKQPYIKSKDFHINKKNHTSHAPGYMFWDDVHPTATVHSIIAEIFYEQYENKYKFTPPKLNKQHLPPRMLFHQFIEMAKIMHPNLLNTNNKKSGFANFFSNLFSFSDEKNIISSKDQDELKSDLNEHCTNQECHNALQHIIKIAKNENTKEARQYREILRQLNWIGQTKELDPEFEKAFENMNKNKSQFEESPTNNPF